MPPHLVQPPDGRVFVFCATQISQLSGESVVLVCLAAPQRLKGRRTGLVANQMRKACSLPVYVAYVALWISLADSPSYCAHGGLLCPTSREKITLSPVFSLSYQE